jgi:CheY-like chemotaxis protein
MEFYPETVDLEKTANEIRDVLRTLTARKRIRISVDVDKSLGSVVADPSKLKQVLYNYLSNALKFTPDNGNVALRIQPEDPTNFRIEVEDNGIGIRSEDQARLFVEFQQLDASTAKRYQGTGLGLALTKRIVEAQGGRVGVVSASGRGSTFYAILPRVLVGTGELPAPSLSVSLAQNAPSVLIVEDEVSDANWVSAILRENGYRVEVAYDGVHAAHACQLRRFDAILLDIALSDVSGWDVLRGARAAGANRRTPVIVVSLSPQQNAGRGFAVHDFLAKPVVADALLDSLRRANVNGNQRNRVLVIDDDPIAVKVAEQYLVEGGYDVTVAANGAQGLEAVKAAIPHAVVLDLLMPDVDGYEFLLRFRTTEGCEDVPVIVWTIKDLSAREQSELRSAAQAVVNKGGQEGLSPLLAELRRQLPVPRPVFAAG